jgi:DNA-binding CsgD family transcriptional regulator/tetratricopeptide (TPR) repeat protein
VTLVDRDRELTHLARLLSAAGGGSGAGVAISGEPGVGKSAVVEAACAAISGLRILRGGCDPLSTPRPLGPFRDALPELADLEHDATLATVCDATFAALRRTPTALVIEDLHWVDTATVELLRFLVRRLEAMPCALILTYRSDEIGDRHPARPLLGDVAALPTMTTLTLTPLSVSGVARLLGDKPVAAQRVHEITGGNPFFVQEVAKEPDLPLPLTVRDAVLARTAGLSAADLEVLQLAAAAPDRLVDRVLPRLGVDLPTLRRLQATGLLLRDDRGLVFRHELARIAVESTIPPGGAAALHGRLLDALERIEPHDAAVLTHHAVAAADGTRALRYAEEAAAEASRTGSHREAVAFLQIALGHVSAQRPRERAQLLTALSHEQYMTSQLQVAIDSANAALALWHRESDLAGVSAAHESCAIFEYYNAQRRTAEDHADRAASFAPDTAGDQYGAASATRAYLAYHRGRYPAAVDGAREAAHIAATTGNQGLALRSSVIAAVVDLVRDGLGARERVIELINQARAAGLDELASTGYSNLSYLDVEQRRFAAAERVLENSLRYTVERDIPICNHWQTAVRSRLRFLAGRWQAALEDAEDALERSGMPLAQVWPHLVSGLASLRTEGSDGQHFEAAWELAERLDEPLRRLPVLSALAERMWLTETPDRRVTTTAVAELAVAATDEGTVWSRGELAVWLWRLGTAPVISPHSVAEPYRLTLTGRHEDAADWWKRAGAVFDEAMSNSDSAVLRRRIEAVEQLDILGATATADRVRRRLRNDGITHLPARPRASTRGNPAGLTNRQLDVAKLVARGLTNAEIAERLFISPKTTDHHVSAVLTKLGMPNRRAVVAQAAALGLD